MKMKIKNLLRSYFFDGLLLTALGIAMLIWPGKALETLCIIIGGGLVFIGLLKIISFFISKSGSGDPSDLLIGIIQSVAGVFFIVKPNIFIESFFIITGVLLIYGAILMFARAYNLRSIKGPMFTFSLIFAVITTVLAVIILINPESFGEFIFQLRGISLIVEGVSIMIALSKTKKAIKEAKK